MKEWLRDMLEEVIWMDMSNFTIIGYYRVFAELRQESKKSGV
jgi:hypothetical protein